MRNRILCSLALVAGLFTARAALFPSGTTTVADVASLASLGTNAPTSVLVLGVRGGEFQRVAAATYSTNTGTVYDGTGCQWVRSEWLRTGTAKMAWFGVTGDGSTDDTTAFQNYLDCGATNLVFGIGTSRGNRIKITSTVTVPAQVSRLDFEPSNIRAYWPTNQNTPCFVVGSAGNTVSLIAKNIGIIQMVGYTWPMDVTTNRALFRIYNPMACKLQFRTLNGGTIGTDVQIDYGASNNEFDYEGANCDNVQYGFVVNATGTGYFNQNVVHGGHFGTTALWDKSYSINNGFSRYGDCLWGSYAHHENYFYNRGCELQDQYASPGEAIAVWLNAGANNTWDNLYLEAITRPLKVTGAANNNVIHTCGTTGTQVNTDPPWDWTGATNANIVSFQGKLYQELTKYLVYDSGPLGQVTWQDGSAYRIPPPWRYMSSSYTTNNAWIFDVTSASGITNWWTKPANSQTPGHLLFWSGRGIGLTFPTVRAKRLYVVPKYVIGAGYGTITSGSPTITGVTDINTFVPWMVCVNGPTGIATGTYITAVDYVNKTLTMSANATASGSVTLKNFGNRGRIAIRPLLHGGTVDTNLANFHWFGSTTLTTSSSYGSCISWPSTDTAGQFAFEVGTDIEAVDIFFIGSTYPVRLESVKVYSPDPMEGPVSHTIPLTRMFATGTPTNGTWYAGTTIQNTAAAGGAEWVVTSSGTAGTLGTVNARLTNASPVFSVDTAAHNLNPGDFIQAGYGMTGRIIWIDQSGTNICVSANASVSDTGWTNALSYTAPTFATASYAATTPLNITGVSGSVTVSTNIFRYKLNPNADYVLTSAPQISDGADGQIICLYTDDAEANTITFTDEGTHANSNLYVGGTGTNVVLSAHNSRQFIFTGGSWNLLTR